MAILQPDVATVRSGSLRITFIPVVIFLVGVVLLVVVLVLLIFIWLFSKEDIRDY